MEVGGVGELRDLRFYLSGSGPEESERHCAKGYIPSGLSTELLMKGQDPEMDDG